jgi:hypothetical protein
MTVIVVIVGWLVVYGGGFVGGWLVRRQVDFKPRNCCAQPMTALGGWCGRRVRIGYMAVCWSNFCQLSIVSQ